MKLRAKQTIVSALGAMAALALPTALIVSCGEGATLQVESIWTPVGGAAAVGGTTDFGDKNDKSFNNQAFDVVKAFSTETKFNSPANDTQAAIASAYATLAQNGVKTIVAAGWKHKDAVISALEDPSFSNDTNFILLDETVARPRVLNINFKSEQVGFLVGYIAAAKAVLVSADTPEVLVYGGLDQSPVYSFMGGFQQGVKYYNDQLNPNPRVTITKLGDLRANYFLGGFSPTDANIDSKVMVQLESTSTADVVFPVAGPQAGTILSKIVAGQRAGKYANKFVIGVDADLAAQQPANDTATRGVVLTSALKNIATTTSAAINLLYGTSVRVGETLYPAPTEATTKVFSSLLTENKPETIWGKSVTGGISELFVSIPNESALPTLIGEQAATKYQDAKKAALNATPDFVPNLAV